MSWLYRFFKKSDDEQTVTVTAAAIQLTGDVTVTGALTTSGGVETEVSELVYWQTVYNTATIGTLSVSTLATTPLLNVTNTGTVASLKGTTAAVTGLSTLGYATVTNTATAATLRNNISPLFLGTGTLGVFFGTATPWDTGVANADLGSMYCQTLSTGSIYRKYGYASKSWATLVATTTATY